jgi:hypothetical protein
MEDQVAGDPGEQTPSGFAGLTPKEAKILRDRLGLSLTNPPGSQEIRSDKEEDPLLAIAGELARLKKKP